MAKKAKSWGAFQAEMKAKTFDYKSEYGMLIM
jgi:hypothetical protein